MNPRLQQDEHSDYLNDWLHELQTNTLEYKEPIISSATVDFIKGACEHLNQDNHVFIMACDVLEDYINKKNQKGVLIDDKTLVITCIISILSKCIGEVSDLRFRNIQNFYFLIAGKETSPESIRRKELDILNTLEHGLPLSSILDDLKLIHNIFIEPLNLRVNMIEISEYLLCLFYISKYKLFYELKTKYSANDTALEAFKICIMNRLYIPIGITVAALKLTMIKYVINLNTLVNKFSTICKIHPDHLNYIAEEIFQLYKHMSKKKS